MNFLKQAIKFFEYIPKENYEFSIDPTSNNIPDEPEDSKTIFPSLSVNLDYIKTKYNTLINSDIVIREFKIPIRNIDYSAFILFVDGMVDNDSINDFILEPLLLKNSISMKPKESTTTAISKGISVKRVKKFNLEDFIFDSLIPQNSIQKEDKFSDLISKVNSGFCALFIDTISTCFCIETRDIKGRSISQPLNETVIHGAHEGFIENIRTNTGLIRKIINNENLIIEQTHVGKISKTAVAICYMQNITNDSLVSEVKYRINNLSIDYITSSRTIRTIYWRL
ncbi:MAG: spore germination protein [Clostridia bacterium]|nr:spore germination protein [Clostridia bacterium]